MLFTAGCSFVPEYKQPAMPVAGTWPGQLPESQAGSGQTAADIACQDYFTSQTLQQIITMALENNRDLKVALLNIEQSYNFV